MKRSLLLTLEFPPQLGGVATYYYNVAQLLPFDSIIVAAPQQPETKNFDRQQKFLITRQSFLTAASKPSLPLLGSLKLINQRRIVARLITRYQIELLHIGNVLPLGTVALSLKLPYIVYTHGLDVLGPQRHWRKRLLLKKILRRAKYVVANSYFTKDHITRLGIPAERIMVITPCPNLEPASISTVEVAALRQDYGAVDKKVVLTVGRLVKRKGVDTVLHALVPLVRKIPNLLYIVVGDGPEKKELQQLAHNLLLGNHVRFVGHLANRPLAGLYQLCDVFVMPSRQIGHDVEGYGIVYLEANLFGKPVIGGRSGGVPEAIVDGTTGLLVEPNNPRELTAALANLLTNASLASRLGAQGMQRVLEECRWHHREEQIYQLLD
jgi:phosphatidyl-myo-inositol dimannoside synthase